MRLFAAIPSGALSNDEFAFAGRRMAKIARRENTAVTLGLLMTASLRRIWAHVHRNVTVYGVTSKAAMPGNRRREARSTCNSNLIKNCLARRYRRVVHKFLEKTATLSLLEQNGSLMSLCNLHVSGTRYTLNMGVMINHTAKEISWPKSMSSS